MKLLDEAELTNVRQIAEERLAKLEQFAQAIEKRQRTQRNSLAAARASSGPHARDATPLLEALVSHDQTLMVLCTHAARDLREKLQELANAR